MSAYANHNGRPVPDFIPASWLLEFGAEARRQVHTLQPVERQELGRRWGPKRVFGVGAVDWAVGS